MNDVAERRNRTLLDMVRSMMSRTSLPIAFWGYALETAAHILNLVPTKKVAKTPHEMWTGKAPSLAHIRFGVARLSLDKILTISSNLEVSDVFSSATHRHPLDISSIDRRTMLSLLRGEEFSESENS